MVSRGSDSVQDLPTEAVALRGFLSLNFEYEPGLAEQLGSLGYADDRVEGSP